MLHLQHDLLSFVLLPIIFPGIFQVDLLDLANFVDFLGDEFDIRIVTLDRDVFDKQSYQDIVPNTWNIVGKAKVFYLSPERKNFWSIAALLRSTPHDVLYLNCFFHLYFTVLPLIVRRLRISSSPPCVLAPRGCFSQGALSIKQFKKRVYISLANLFCLYRDLYWQASTEFEAHDIRREFGVSAKYIEVAPNLTFAPASLTYTIPKRRPGPLRLIFLSRITPKKNLHFLLSALSKVTSNVEVSIYGPIEDLVYWDRCKSLINRISPNISVSFNGHIAPEEVPDVFLAHDLFVFPTLGENFGHVIHESLMCGTPVLVSDRTPWLPDKKGALQVLPLDISRWAETVSTWSCMDNDSLEIFRHAAHDYFRAYSEKNKSVDLSRSLFNKFVRRS